ncbi:MAG: hypothetical protein ACLQGJ_12020 [Candidatus Dormibacteria bacterium]
MSDSIGGIPLRILEEAARQLEKVVPPEATSHFLAAQREMVLGITALIEHGNRPASGASRGSRAPAAGSRARRPRRVPVD